MAVLQFRAGIRDAAGPGEPGQALASEDILFCSSLQPQPGLGVVTGLFKLRCSIYFWRIFMAESQLRFLCRSPRFLFRPVFSYIAPG